LTTKVTARVSINSKPTEVFKYLKHLKYHFLWNPFLQKLDPISALKTGMKYNSVITILGVKIKSTNKVMTLTSDKELTIENSTGILKYKVCYRLLEKGHSQTSVICTTTVETDNRTFAFSGPVLKVLAQRELQSDLQALKVAVEQQLDTVN
jgi:hypothetical protein